MSDPQEHPAVRKFVKELNSGTVSLVLLTIIEGSDKPLYGYEIAKLLEQSISDELPMKRGTLYPALRSMEEKGLLESEVEPSISGPPRKYYSITDQGRKALVVWKETWRRTRDFVDGTLEGDVDGDD
jgi:PadR family transcriptional regulator PadR